MRPLPARRMALLGLLVATLAGPGAAAQEPAGLLERGAYLFAAGGCAGCHTRPDGPLLAGGRAIETPFGTFYGPNITPDPTHGIGAWTDADFVRSLRQGVAPGGSHYYPAFPYTSFTKIADADMLAIKAYIFSLPAVAEPDRPHALALPLRWRLPLALWKRLHFEPGAFEPDSARDAQWNRGAYLAQALLHCAECHTPRTWTGGLDRDRLYAGTREGPEGETAPNITSDEATGLGGWSRGQIVRLLKFGLLPDGDVVGSVMGEVVEQSTSKLTEADLEAVAAYLEAIPPVANPDARATQPGWE